LTYGLFGKKASNIQIARMCDAFSNNGINVEIVRPFQVNKTSASEIGINPKTNIKITTLPGVRLLRNYDFLYSTCLGLYAYLFLRGDNLREVVFYGRSPVVMPLSVILKLKQRSKYKSFFPRIFCEVHQSFPGYDYRVMNYLDGIIVITESLKRHLLEYGISEHKILVAPDGVNIGLYTPYLGKHKYDLRRELGLPLDSKIVMFSGHLYEDRGIETLLESLRYLELSVIVVLVGGYNKDIKRIRKYAVKLGIEKRVIIVGYIPSTLVPKYQVSADVLVIPYSNKWKIQQWSSPLKLFEYMASKVPIVSTDFESLREVLENNRNAILVTKDNPPKLAQAVQRVLESRELAERISDNAFADVQMFTWEKRAKKILTFIDRLGN